MSGLNDLGQEVLDDTQIALPLKFRQKSFIEQMQEFVRAELSKQADAGGHETFEESDDFEVGDDAELSSPYELEADQEFYEAPSAASAVADADGGATAPPTGLEPKKTRSRRVKEPNSPEDDGDSDSTVHT